MNIDVDLPLGDVVNQVPGSARVLESFGLDYCCGGQVALADACAARDIDPVVVLDALSGIDGAVIPEWVSMTPIELVDHLEATHHAFLHTELPRLDALAEKVASVHGERHPELLEVLADFRDLRDDLEPHLAKEERVLFPMIRELGAATEQPHFHCGSLRNPISVMLREHDLAGDLLVDLRRDSGEYRLPDDACASYRALYEGLVELETDTHLHVHKENNLLFPAVVALEEGWVTQ